MSGLSKKKKKSRKGTITMTEVGHKEVLGQTTEIDV